MPDTRQPISQREYQLLGPLVSQMQQRIEAAKREIEEAKMPLQVAFASILAARDLPAATVFKGLETRDGVFAMVVALPEAPAARIPEPTNPPRRPAPTTARSRKKK